MEIKKQVREFVASNFYIADQSKLNDTASLLDLGIVDSTGMLEIIFFLNDAFKIKVEDSEMVPENLDSVERIASYVARKTGLN